MHALGGMEGMCSVVIAVQNQMDFRIYPIDQMEVPLFWVGS